MAKPNCTRVQPVTAAEPDLPYRIDLWDSAGHAVELTLAMAHSSATAYACYYAALREHFGRQITLRAEGKVLAATGRSQA